MTCYNHRAHLEEAIDSVLMQTLPEIELVLVDDGSSDRSVDLVRACKDERIRYIWQRNAGPSDATNCGIRAARGEYIALVGGDDVCSPNRAELQLEQLMTSEADIIFSLPVLID